MALRPGTITVARCWEKDDTFGEAGLHIAYASHDVSEEDAAAVLASLEDARESAAARGDRDPSRVQDRVHAVLDGVDGRYALTGFDCRRVAADRLARIASWTRSVDPDRHPAKTAVEGFADRVFARLAAVHDCDHPGRFFRPFLRSLDGDDLDAVFPEEDDATRAEILCTLSPRRRRAVDAAAAKVGAPDDGWSTDELRRSLRLHVDHWRDSRPSLHFAYSDAACAQSLGGLPGVRGSLHPPEGEAGGAAMRLAVLIASEATFGSGAEDAVNPRSAVRVARHTLPHAGSARRVAS